MHRLENQRLAIRFWQSRREVDNTLGIFIRFVASSDDDTRLFDIDASERQPRPRLSRPCGRAGCVDRHRAQPRPDVRLIAKRVDLADERHGDFLEQILEVLMLGHVGEQHRRHPATIGVPHRLESIRITAHRRSGERVLLQF